MEKDTNGPCVNTLSMQNTRLINEQQNLIIFLDRCKKELFPNYSTIFLMTESASEVVGG